MLYTFLSKYTYLNVHKLCVLCLGGRYTLISCLYCSNGRHWATLRLTGVMLMMRSLLHLGKHRHLHHPKSPPFFMLKIRMWKDSSWGSWGSQQKTKAKQPVREHLVLWSQRLQRSWRPPALQAVLRQVCFRLISFQTDHYKWPSVPTLYWIINSNLQWNDKLHWQMHIFKFYIIYHFILTQESANSDW